MRRLNTLQISVIGAAIAVAIFTTYIFFIMERPEPSQLVNKDIEFEIKGLELNKISEDEIKIKVTFSILNPNFNTIILEAIDYQLFADDVKIVASGVGERIGNALVGSSENIFHLVPGLTIDIHDEVLVKKIPSLEGIWTDLQNNDVRWKIKGSYVITEPQREASKEHNFEQSL